MSKFLIIYPQTTEHDITLYSSDGRAEDCHPAAPGSIPASAKLKLRSLNITSCDGYIVSNK